MTPPSAWLLDLTRTVSRLGRGPLTGIDRVELAYLQYLLTRPEPIFGLVRTALGFVLLNKDGARGVLHRIIGAQPLGQVDVLARLTNRHLPQNARAEADARRLALARCLPVRLTVMLHKRLPAGTAYVNVGHANLTMRVMRAVKSLPGGQAVVMVHDTIPLDYPQFCRAGMQRGFANKLAVVSAQADLVVHTALCTRALTEMHFARAGRVPLGVVAPLGTTLTPPDVAGLGSGHRPYYVALGTIEPRKNLGLLAKVWRHLQEAGRPVPHLFIIGNRGWESRTLFAEFDALAKGGAVSLLHTLDDAAVSALLQDAEALLFPSFAEGFGLPPVEAAALGVPVFSGKLPVVVETLQDYPVYLDTSDVYAWVEAINHQLKHRKQGRDADRQIRVPPNWPDHFAKVFSTP